MKHPVRNDFDVAVSEAGVTVSFRPTRSIYSFYRPAGTDDIARLGHGYGPGLGPVSLEREQHAGASGDTEDYPSDEVQKMAQHIASEVAASVWPDRDREQTDKLTTVRPVPMVGDEGD
jgi:hypothetical protein